MIYDISYKTLICSKPLGIKFDKIDGLIGIYVGIYYEFVLKLVANKWL